MGWIGRSTGAVLTIFVSGGQKQMQHDHEWDDSFIGKGGGVWGNADRALFVSPLPSRGNHYPP